MLSSLPDDLRLALRSLLRRPGFALVAILTLALGIGANTAIFSVVNRLMLDPLPFDDADRIVSFARVAKAGQMSIPPSAEQIEAVAAHARSFEIVAPFNTGDVVVSSAEGEPALARGGRMTDALPRLLRLRPVLGRFILPEEAREGGADVAVLGHGYWRRAYGGDESVLGDRIVLDGKPFTIVGVMDPALDREQEPIGGQDVWTPLRVQGEWGAPALARLKPGVTIEQADAEARRIASEVEEKHFAETFALAVRPPVDTSAGANRMLLVMLGAVGMVLLVACANVANLLLARAASRRHEIGVRLALGATRGRLVQGLLVESVILALAGGALGILLAVWGIDAIAAIRPDTLDELASVSLDPIVLWFTVGVSVLSGIVFGLVPALRASRPSLVASLRSGTAGAGIAVEGRRLRAGLVVAEVALSVVLLVGAGLLVRSVMKLQAVDPGYEPRGLLTARVVLGEDRYPSDAERTRIFDELVARVREIPQVEGAAVAMTVPPRSGILFGTPTIDGGVLPAEETANPVFSAIFGGREFLEALRIPLVEGRPLDPRRMEEAMVNERLARRWWPDESAIGKRFSVANAGQPPRWQTVVGVTRDIVANGVEEKRTARQIYHTFEGVPPWQTLVVRVADGVEPTSLAPAIQSIMTSIDPLAPLREVSTTEFQLRRAIARPRFTMVLLATFATLALLLSAIGLYGVISYTVTERTREIGIRMALGALPRGIFALVVRQGIAVALVGLVVGTAAALAAGRALAGLLYEVGARDPATIAAVAATVLATALAALLVPARRATRVDPAGAMRTD
jgi:predicted permease